VRGQISIHDREKRNQESIIYLQEEDRKESIKKGRSENPGEERFRRGDKRKTWGGRALFQFSRSKGSWVPLQAEGNNGRFTKLPWEKTEGVL